jgi:predicted ATPase/DNA-binding winged helix-turn-helix (wHTH) protein
MLAWHGTEVVTLSPKAFDVLHYLVKNPHRLVTKEELLEAVWPETAVTDAVIRVAIGTLRKALRDTAPPCFIATVPRRGYRFLASVAQTSAVDMPMAPPASQDFFPTALSPPLIGRESVLYRLGEAWMRARQGQRQVVLVTGEAGMGKTAVVEAFCGAIMATHEVWLATGQCVEHYGVEEPYLPVLEALGQLCRGTSGERLAALLQQHAPTWLAQMPWLLTPERREQLRHELQGVTRERMLREFADAVDALTTETPLVLILEDMHWSDYATLDLLSLLAQRRTPARLFIIGTYRPVEAIAHHHPLRAVAQDLRRHGHATELPLALLSAEGVAAYLAARFAAHRLPSALASWLHQRTDGHPLFLVALAQALVERGVLLAQDGCWTVNKDSEALASDVPESLRQLIEQQVSQLPLEMQRTLEAASVAGVEFADAAVAAALNTSAAMVEAYCEALAEQAWLRPLDVALWPDGTIATRYTFAHALYQQVLYERLGLGRRMRLHQRLGERLEAAYGARAEEIAAELAEHFMRSPDARRAVPYLHQVAEQALRRCAHQEAIGLLTQALAFLTTLPDTLERRRRELALQIALGQALIATRGYAAPEVAQAYARARDLCRSLGDATKLFTALRGLQLFHVVRAELQAASNLAEELLLLAQRQQEPVQLAFAHLALGIALFHRGAFAPAQSHLEQVIAYGDATPPQAHLFLYGNDATVVCLAWMALTLWLLGYPDQAQRRGQEALARAQRQAHPFSLAFALAWSAWLHQLRREPQAAQAQAEAAMTVCAAQGFAQFLAFACLLRGWALIIRQPGEDGLAHMHQGWADYQATGAAIGQPHYLFLLAEAYGQMGQPEAGLTMLTDALAVVGQTEERSYEAELYRLTGQLLLARSDPLQMEADTSLRRALAVARQQQAKALELRAATSLARLWRQQGQGEDAYRLLSEVYDWFTEGFETTDLREARALLNALAKPGWRTV